MIFGYCRVSTNKQDLSKYIEQLKSYGIDEDNIYQDTMTGTKRDREGLNELLSKVKEGDTIVIPDMTRLGRSTIDLLNIVDELKSKYVHVRSLKEQWLDTTSSNPQSALMLTMFSALAQYERDLISMRTKETLAHKKAMNGGKSINGRPSKSNETKNTIIKMYNQGTWKISEIQQATNCSRNTVYKYINEGKKEGKIS
ncbi:recombinase family protein [Paraclostridium sordellii]|uniref:recombinase family protein n=1 Tax=Paraclostridium sordellii TaxID=1505 RepID=UPI0005DB1FAF|nr:recombinase family protein [Paeniclostridium sordellii]CEP43709.1 resolvase [[Clostridium] sordellii] [Paeniclostridium sordellii]CEP50458.1 resolvase [[Clostridium] sordellii] [Paeniclostridium sordellii]